MRRACNADVAFAHVSEPLSEPKGIGISLAIMAVHNLARIWVKYVRLLLVLDGRTRRVETMHSIEHQRLPAIGITFAYTLLYTGGFRPLLRAKRGSSCSNNPKASTLVPS